MTIPSAPSQSDILVVNTTTAKTIINYLNSKGFNHNQILQNLNCTSENLDTPDTFIPLSTYNTLWQLALSFTHDPLLSLKLAQNPYNNEMSLVSHVFFNSLNLKEGLKQYIRYYSLINQSISVHQSSKNNNAIVSYHCSFPEFYCAPDIEHSIALSVTRIKEHISGEIFLEEVHFAHSCHDLPAFEAFFGCPVYFNQKHSAIIFKNKFLDFTFPKKSTHLFNLLSSHLETLLHKLKKPKNTISFQVSKLIEKSLSSGQFDAEHISQALHMSRHTLYRKLKLEGVSFHELVDRVRKEKAQELIRKNQHTLSEIAFLLGFSELSSFSRAFKKWTGKSPAHFLK